MFIIPIQVLDEIVNDHFWCGGAQAHTTNDETELQEQSLANGVDEE